MKKRFMPPQTNDDDAYWAQQSEGAAELPGRLFLWAYVVLQAPRVANRLNDEERHTLLEKIRNEEQFFSHEVRGAELRAQLEQYPRLHHDIEVATHGVSEPPTSVCYWVQSGGFGTRTAKVTFSLAPWGEVLAKTEGLPKPIFVREPRTIGDAKEMARQLLHAAGSQLLMFLDA